MNQNNQTDSSRETPPELSHRDQMEDEINLIDLIYPINMLDWARATRKAHQTKAQVESDLERRGKPFSSHILDILPGIYPKNGSRSRDLIKMARDKKRPYRRTKNQAPKGP